ncbi:MAG TPA: GDP-mannose 4,6-dehydratase [Anaerolineae bacterium]|nr:GDP-mannose 4,6-dehydratase [Anaerolineae bacterium]
MRALITGAAGFVGSHLADVIHTETDWQIWGTILGVEDPRSVPVDGSILKVDLRDPDQVRAAIEQAQPDFIFHLAGQAYVPQSWNDPWATYETNIRSQLNLLQAVSAIGLRPKIMVVGSNEEYGWVSESDLPIDEDTPLRPNSPYSVSKIAQDFMGLQYFLDRDLPVVRVRPFNHIGPRQNERFVAPSFAKQIIEIERGLKPPVLKLGYMSARRDFTDVRDMCRAYILAVQKGEPGEMFNIGSGQARSVRELLDMMLAHSSIKVTEEADPSKMRLSDVPVSYCDPTKFKQRTGWEPRITFEQTVIDILDDWRERIK